MKITRPNEFDFDWEYVFRFADGTADNYPGEPDVRTTELAEKDTDTSPFGSSDVDYMIAMSDGENDEQDWVGAGRLKDGRWFYIEAGCDYTGWG